MNRKVMSLLLIALILSLILVACGDNEENKTSNDGAMFEITGESSGKLSSEETDLIIEALVKVTAEKFSLSEDEYLDSLKKSGKTAKEEFQLAADMMGISLKDYYEYEKIAVSKMTEEEKAISAGMAGALSEIAGMDIESETADAQDAAADFLNAMTSSGGDRVVEGDVEELCYFKVDEVIEVDVDDTYGTYYLEYNSNADFEELYEYFQALLVDTPGSMIVKIPGVEAASLVGTISNNMVAVYIDNEDGDDVINIMVESYKQ